jgi:hypothetical protein
VVAQGRLNGFSLARRKSHDFRAEKFQQNAGIFFAKNTKLTEKPRVSPAATPIREKELGDDFHA